MTTETTIEFTDRYGGQANWPSWLRGCHDQCEAMGWVPVQGPFADPKYQALWNDAHNAPDAHADEQCDGWHFVRCPSCKGTARVPWYVAVARVPRWLWKGLTFYRFAMRPDVSPPGWTWRQRFRVWFWAAYGSELQRLARDVRRGLRR